MKTQDLTRVALMLALLAVCSQIALPIGPVPITLQTLVVLIIGLILPTGQALLTMSLYLVLGLIGLPIFSQAMGGLQSVFLPSFGFILSFIPAVWVMSKICHKKNSHSIRRYVIAVIAGNLIIYIIGLSYMSFILTIYLGNEMSLWQILFVGMIPFIPGDIAKSIVAVTASKRLNSYLRLQPL